ncbi:MAG: hypothetical protein Q9164_002976 [Protoblastenia rupestris]
MIRVMPPPDPRSLLPPLLACLPTAFASPRPPPALLPLLSPILRQRVQLLATTTSSPTESWLPLLCWDSELAQRLVHLITESDAFELHPTSGEIEFGSIEQLKYRSLDEETLQARIRAPDMGLEIIVLWCEGTEDGEGHGWRVSEVRPLDHTEDVNPDQWRLSATEAEEQCRQKAFEEAVRETHGPTSGLGPKFLKDDDADYWAQYDDTPSRTPGARHSPGPHLPTSHDKRARTTSEAEYFERYAQVQPEMDSSDNSISREAIGESTLNGDTIVSASRFPQPEPDNSLSNGVKSQQTEIIDTHISNPTASPPSSGPATVSRLEALAGSHSPTDLAVRQHVSMSIKSLFRLCRGTGIEGSDFGDMVRTELETLSMMEDDG